MLIAECDAAGIWLGGYDWVADDAVCPPGWRIVATPPPALAAGQLALLTGASWAVIDQAQRPPLPASVGPRRISKIEFSRLFTTEQMVKYLALKAQAKALTPPDFADPSKAVLIQAAVMFEKFDMLPDLLELDHAETIAGVSQLLVAAGVLTAIDAARILANVPPAE